MGQPAAGEALGGPRLSADPADAGGETAMVNVYGVFLKPSNLINLITHIKYL